MSKNALEEIKKYQAAIADLKAEAIADLESKKEVLLGQIADIDAEIEELTGKPVKASSKGGAQKAGKPFPWKSKEELAAAIKENGGKIGFRKKSDADFARKLDALVGGDKAFPVKEAAAWCFVSHK